ncbi:MAG TPA: sortase [Actinomycetota bacterium]|nr:sortase [Actinomycetota bacterium]
MVCLVAAGTVLGYQAWLFWGTGLHTARAQRLLRAEIQRQLQEPSAPNPLPARKDRKAPEPVPVHFDEGDPVAILRIPRIGLDTVVVEGTSPEVLTMGPGRYLGSAYPWDQAGRVAISGHRTTYLRPFWDLDKLRPGDPIVLVTRFGTYRYRVTRSAVVDPDDLWVLRQTREPTLVLTTCTPRFFSFHRLVVFAER